MVSWIGECHSNLRSIDRPRGHAGRSGPQRRNHRAHCFLSVISYLRQVILSGGWEAPGLTISRRKILLLGTYEDSGGWRQILASFPNGGTASPHGACPGGRTGISLLSPQSPPPTPTPTAVPRTLSSQPSAFSLKGQQQVGFSPEKPLPPLKSHLSYRY